MKLLTDLGALAVGSRAAHFADLLFEEVQAIYRAQGLEFDSRNFLLFRALLASQPSSVGELALQIGCTHARVSQKLAELEKQALVERVDTGGDRRRSCFQLKTKGKHLVKLLTPVWDELEQVLLDDFRANELLAEISRAEELLRPGILSTQVLSRLAARGTSQKVTPSSGLTMRAINPLVSPRLMARFEQLNRAWLKEYDFKIEGGDLDIFRDLNSYLLAHQGCLIVAEVNSIIQGTAILVQHNSKEYELAKFCVDPTLRGLGIGRLLLNFCETEVLLRGATSIVLETSSKLTAAKSLYEKAGFVTEARDGSLFSRVDLCMRKTLK